MFTIHGIELNDVVYFKKVKFDLDKNPLTFVRGLNYDADSKFDPTSNGTGKSLLFSCTPNVFYFSPPSASKKNSKKELLGKTSSNKVTFTTPLGVTYGVTQTSKGYKIEENGVDLKYGRIPDAEKFIRSIFPLLEIDYYTYCYLSTQRPYLMQSDTNLNRLDHLTAIFRLDSYDLMRSHFIKMLASIKSNELKLSVLEQQSVDLQVRLKKISRDKAKYIKSPKDEIQAVCEVHRKDLEQSQKQAYQLSQELSTLTALKKVEVELDALRAKYPYKTKPSVMYTTLVQERKLLRAYSSYRSAFKVYKASMASTTAKLSKLTLPKLSKKALLSKLEGSKESKRKISRSLRKLEDAQLEYERKLKEVAGLKQSIEELGVDVQKIDPDVDYTSELARCMSTIKLSSLLDHEHLDEESSACPVCLSPVDLDNIRDVVAKAKKQLTKIKAYTKARLLTKSLKSAKKEARDLKPCPDLLQEQTGLLHEADKSIDTVLKHISIVEKHENLTEQLNSIDKPVKPSALPSVVLTLEEADNHIELCSDILRHLEVKQSLAATVDSISDCRTAAEVDTLIRDKTQELKSVEKWVVTVRSMLAKSSTELEATTRYDTEIRTLQSSLQTVTKEIATLRPGVEDKKVLETLVKAYSKKGLKTLVANEVCSLLETNLNHYRHLVFAEPFTFTVNSSESGLSLIVDRKNGIVSDVRNLSGAESNSFRLLFLISILVLLPSDRRLNMVVLDEPCSHSDEVSREIFLTRYLPALQEIVPNIYVITPNLSDNLEGSVDLIVQKKNGKSTLHTNHLRNCK